MTVPETSGERRFVRPADYYSSATPAPVLPSWAAYGCGAAAVAVLIIVFAGGAWLSSGGFVDFMDLAIGMSVAEMKGMYSPDVTAAQKEALDEEISAMRANLLAGKIAVPAVQPFLNALQKAASDSKVTSAEVRSLEDAAKKANAAAKPSGSAQGTRR
jgi:hypothetical protein